MEKNYGYFSQVPVSFGHLKFSLYKFEQKMIPISTTRYFQLNNPWKYYIRRSVIEIQVNKLTVFLNGKYEFALCIFTAVKKPSFIRGQENFYRNQNEEKPPSIANSFLMHYGQPHIQTKLLKKSNFSWSKFDRISN